MKAIFRPPNIRLYKPRIVGLTNIKSPSERGFSLLSIVINHGCNFNCPMCLPKGTKVLMHDFSWKPIEEVREGDHIVSVLEKKNQWAVGEVLAAGSRIARVYRIHTSDGEFIDLTDDHPLLTPGHRWRHIGQAPIQVGRRIAKIPFIDWEIDEDYRIGYLRGAIEGDGNFKQYHYPYQSTVYRFRLAVKDREFMEKVRDYLNYFGIHTQYRLFRHTNPKENWAPLYSIYTHGKDQWYQIESLISKEPNTKNYWRGYLAGVFDAEGGWSGNAIRITNTDLQIIETIEEVMNKLGYKYVIEEQDNSEYRRKRMYKIRLLGRMPTKFRFFQEIRSSIPRKYLRLLQHRGVGWVWIEDIEELGEMEVYNLTTSIHTYVANGYITHNCFWKDKTSKYNPLVREMTNEAFFRGFYKFYRYVHRDHNGYPYFDISFFGTEPSLSIPKVLRYTEFLRLMGARQFNMTTNGYALTKEAINRLHLYNYHINVSFEGTRERQDIIRPLKGNGSSYTKVRNNLLYMRDRKMRINVLMLAEPLMGHKVYEGMRAILDMELPLYINLDTLSKYTDEQLQGMLESFDRIAQFMIDNPQYLKRVGPYTRVIGRMMRRSVWNIFGMDIGTCGAAKGGVGMTIDGRIVICHKAAGEVDPKDVEVFALDTSDGGIDPDRVMWWRSLSYVTGSSIFPLLNVCWVRNYWMTGDIQGIDRKEIHLYHLYYKHLIEPVVNEMIANEDYRERVKEVFKIKQKKG